MKKALCIILTLLLLPLCALGDEAAFVMAGFDDAEVGRDWSSNLFFARMQERTGVAFTYQQYSNAAQWTSAKAAMKAGAEMPDVLFKAELTTTECIDMLQNGALIDLAPYLDACCPNLSALLKKYPDVRDDITLPDGRIVSLPYITTNPQQNCVWINQNWLSALRLNMPGTAEELTAVLRAFKTGDPNRNGKADEVPLSFIGPFDLKFLGHAFGLVANDYNLRCEDGTVTFVAKGETYRAFVTWLRDLYAEGLIDKNGFYTVDTMRKVSDSKAAVTYGALLNTMTANVLPVDWTKQYAVLPPLEYEGKRVYRDFAGKTLRGTFAVTSACKNPEAMLRWVDTLYGEEGAILAAQGIQGTDYIIDGDGTWRMADEEAMRDNSYVASITISSGGTPPGVSPDNFQRRYNDDTVAYVSSQIDIVNASAVRPFPAYALTKAQEAEIAPLQNKIGLYVDMSLANFVLGETPLTDEAFAEYEQTLDEYGLSAFVAFWQNIVDTQAKER